jgi:hypothetical protein
MKVAIRRRSPVPAAHDRRDADEAGLLLVPAMVGITLSTNLAGRAISRTGPLQVAIR